MMNIGVLVWLKQFAKIAAGKAKLKIETSSTFSKIKSPHFNLVRAF